MRKLYFRKEEECMYFCELLFQRMREIDLSWGKRKRHTYELILQQEVKDEALQHVFVQLFLHYRFRPQLRSVIQEDFHYEVEDEIEAIVDWVDWIVMTKEYNEKLYAHYRSFHQFLHPLFARYIFGRTNIHFDDMCRFSKNELQDMLRQMIGYAIDEWKEEERYQSFIHSIRLYMQQRPAKMDVLHILHDENFHYFTYDGHMITRQDVQEEIEKEPLYIFGLDVVEFHLAPVLTFMPEKIYIYTNYLADAKITTLRNIFDENVIPLRKEYFPFPQKNIY